MEAEKTGKVRGGWRGQASSLAALRDNAPHDPLPAGHESASVRVSCGASDLRWWRGLSATERGRVVAAARYMGLTGNESAAAAGFDYAE